MACGGEMRIVRSSCCLYCPLFDIRSLVAGAGGKAAKTVTTTALSPIRTIPLPFLPRLIRDAFIINNAHATSIPSHPHPLLLTRALIVCAPQRVSAHMI